MQHSTLSHPRNRDRCGRRDLYRTALVCVALLGAPLACGGTDAAGPAPPGNVLDGVAYTASVEILDKLVVLRVTLTNTTTGAITRSYPAGCPVRIRLYRLTDNALVYDESQAPCGSTTPVSVTIAPQQSASLTSGPRYRCTIAGDSLPTPATYFAAALVRIVGMNPIELDAGTYSIPKCPEEAP